MGVGISVQKLNAWFGTTQALHDIEVTVAANHATAIIGPSGCGKSTFIRCLNRMHETIPGARVDYADIVDDEDLQPVARLDRPALAAAAVYLGTTRLIDNVTVG